MGVREFVDTYEEREAARALTVPKRRACVARRRERAVARDRAPSSCRVAWTESRPSSTPPTPSSTRSGTRT